MKFYQQIMYFFSSIHNPVLNAFAQFFTILGEEYVIIAVAMLLFWCIDKRKGFASLFSMLVALNVMNVIKVIVRFPRPWTVLKDLDVVRKETATGWSFPSGHATMTSSFYGGLAAIFKRKHIQYICFSLIVIISLLRVYLCVHWPTDVIVGVAIGVTCAVLLTRYALSFQDNVYRDAKKMMFCSALMIVAGLAVAILCQTGTIDNDMNADLYVGLAISGGVLFFSTLEQTTVAFRVDGSAGLKILRYVVGMIGVIGLLIGLKKVLPAGAVFRFMRYLVTGIWAVWVYPLIGKKLKLFI